MVPPGKSIALVAVTSMESGQKYTRLRIFISDAFSESTLAVYVYLMTSHGSLAM